MRRSRFSNARGNDCVDQRVYGQNTGHSLFNFRGDVDGENSIFNTANDSSGGHSGGPIHSPTYPDSNGPYVLAVVTNGMCGQCGPGEASQNDITYPAMVRRMTAALARLTTAKRVARP